jgi:hypothetical protein
MNDEKFEQLLKEIYTQDITPSENLIQKTKHRLSENRYAQYLIALVVSLNLAAFLAFIGFIIAAPYGMIYKTMLYMAFSSVYNLLALAAYLNSDRINEFFQIKGGYYEQK